MDSLPPYDAVDERNRDFTIETLRQVAEVLVWGENNNRGYFDIFCEQNVLSYFVQLAEQPTIPNAVKVQLLQTLSIIVQSINKETAVCKCEEGTLPLAHSKTLSILSEAAIVLCVQRTCTCREPYIKVSQQIVNLWGLAR